MAIQVYGWVSECANTHTHMMRRTKPLSDDTVYLFSDDDGGDAKMRKDNGGSSCIAVTQLIVSIASFGLFVAIVVLVAVLQPGAEVGEATMRMDERMSNSTRAAMRMLDQFPPNQLEMTAGQLFGIVDDAKSILDQVREALPSLGTIASYRDTHTLMTDLHAMVDRAKLWMMGIDPEDIQATVHSARTLIESIDADKVNAIIEEAKTLLQALNTRATIDHISQLATSAEEILVHIKENPQVKVNLW